MSGQDPTTAAGAAVPERVGVLGGGRMGAGIAHAFLLAGSQVVVVERDEAAAGAAGERIRTSLRRSVERGSTERPIAALEGALETSTDAAVFADAGLVIEAVPEDRALKVESLHRIEAVVARTAAIASNTSSISIDDLGAELAHPERFLGLHFFNPVPASALVEVVVGGSTDQELVDDARGWVAALGKTAVVVADAPGFASSRLGVAIALEAIRMLEEGVATATDIDAAMELGYRHPAPPQLLRDLVADGHLGRKTGRGFYEWSE